MSDSQEEINTSLGDLPNFYPPAEGNGKEDFEITRKEFDQIKNAFKDAQFRKLLSEYVDEIQDPENQKTYQSEVKQLEKQNGFTVHFLNPIAGHVLKTSVDGTKKCFINVCSNPIIKKPSFTSEVQDFKHGLKWSIPYAQSPSREDIDKAGVYCQVFDVIFNPEVLLLSAKNPQLALKLEQTALDAVESSFKVKLDRNNVKKPKLKYKGMPRATIIKYKTGENAPDIVDKDAIKNEIPPQIFKTEACKSADKLSESSDQQQARKNGKPVSKIDKILSKSESEQEPAEWTVPRHSFKYRSQVDLQDYCLDNQSNGCASKPIPDEVILSVDLPLLSDSSTLSADVMEDGWNFELKSNAKAFYELKLKLPFKVEYDSAKAKFDKDCRKLHITMKTAKKPKELLIRCNSDDVFDQNEQTENAPEKVQKQISETDVGYESNESNEYIPTVINGNVVVKSILKGSNSRARSMSESWLEHMDHLNTGKEDFMSLESLSESNEKLTMSESSNGEKSVRFSDRVMEKVYRSNSSILGQRKKNQRKNKSKRKNRERHSSEGSVSSFDGDGDDFKRYANDDEVDAVNEEQSN